MQSIAKVANKHIFTIAESLLPQKWTCRLLILSQFALLSWVTNILVSTLSVHWTIVVYKIVVYKISIETNWNISPKNRLHEPGPITPIVECTHSSCPSSSLSDRPSNVPAQLIKHSLLSSCRTENFFSKENPKSFNTR